MARPKRPVVHPDGRVQVGDPETLKVIADPLRLELLTLLGEAKTAKQLAAELVVPTTRLYYHLRVLESHGLIKVVSRRIVSGIEEKTYRSLGDNWMPAPEITDAALESSGVVGSLINLVQAQMSVAMRANPDGHLGEVDSAAPVLMLTRVSLDRESLVDFQKKLYSLIEEHVCQDSSAPEGEELYHLFVAAYRHAQTPPLPKAKKPNQKKPTQRRTRAPRS